MHLPPTDPSLRLDLPASSPEPRSKRTSSLERLGAVAAATGLLAMAWIHALAAICGRLTASASEPPAWHLTAAALAVGLAAGAGRRIVAGLAAGALAAAALALTGSASAPVTLALLILGASMGAVGRGMSRRLPASLDGSFRVRPARALGVVALAVLALVQVARLGTFMADPATDWFLSTRHPFWAKHGCLSSYLHAAELHERGELNVYQAEHYPGLNPEAQPTTDMQGMTVEDPFQYPPQFLLLPTLARALSHDFLNIQVVWYALQLTLFLGVAIALASWVGGREGRRAALLLPLALTAFPTLHALQYGQFHLAAVALALAAMLAFEAKRPAAGGALLAVAISAKLFPALLLVPLAVRRRWRDLAWTAGFGAAFLLLGLAVLGPAPYTAFLDYQLPRLADGQAFAFGEAWPEIQGLLVADNQGAFGLVEKFQAMGASFLDDSVARLATKLFTLLAVLLAAWFARREAPRHLRVAGWLAVLGLGALMSPGAFGDYVPLTATWLLTFVTGAYGRGWRWAVPLSVCWLFQYTLLGTTPIGSWVDLDVMIPLSALGALALLSLYTTVLGGWLGRKAIVTPILQPSPVRTASSPGMSLGLRVPVWIAFILLGSMLGGRVSAQTVAVTVGPDSDCDYQDLAEAVADVEGLTAAERLVKVQRGLYEGVKVFSIVDHLTIRGGFDTCASPEPTPNAKSILQGNGSASVVELVPRSTMAPAQYRLENLSLEGSTAITGGGLDLEGPADVTLENVLVLANTAKKGGGVYVDASGGLVSLELTNTSINGNQTLSSADGADGAGLYCLGFGTIHADGSSAINGNETVDTGRGGGLYLETCTFTADPGFKIERNRAHSGGGLAAVEGAIVSLEGVKLALNRAEERDGIAGRGGALFVEKANLGGTQIEVSGNRAEPIVAAEGEGGAGGGIFVGARGVVSLEASAAPSQCGGRCLLLSGNLAARGAAGFVSSRGSLALLRAHLTENVGSSVLGVDSSAVFAAFLGVRHSFLAANVAADLIRAAGFYELLLTHSSIGGNLSVENVVRGEGSGTEDLSTVELKSSVVFEVGALVANLSDSVAADFDCLLVHDNLGLGGGSRIFEGDPQFTDPAAGDLHLLATSPAVDRCPESPGASRDIDLEVIPVDQDVVIDDATPADAGADEVPFIEPPPPPEPIFTDGFESGDLSLWSGST